MLVINERKKTELLRPLAGLKKKGIDYLQAEVLKVDPINALVETSVKSLEFDYLVIALGAEHNPSTVPGFVESAFNVYSFEGVCCLRDRLAEFRGGSIILFISSIPYICPLAPYEIIFLLDWHLRQRGIRRKTELTVVTPSSSPEPLAPPRVGGRLIEMLKRREIQLVTEAKVLYLNPLQNTLVMDHVEMEADLFLGVPPHRGPAALQGSGLVVDEGGWIAVHPHTLETRVQKVFAVGDAAALRLPVLKAWAPKAGVFAHYQGEVVARNIARLIRGVEPKYKYTGKGP